MTNMNTKRATLILLTEYTLSELEDRLGCNLADLEYGVGPYVEDNYDLVSDMLKEDLYF